MGSPGATGSRSSWPCPRIWQMALSMRQPGKTHAKVREEMPWNYALKMKRNGMQAERPAHARPPERRFSSKCRRAAAERQPRRGGRANGVLDNSGHSADGGGKNAGLLQRRQARPGGSAQVAMRAGQAVRRITGARIQRAGRHGTKPAQLAGAHLFRQHGHRRQQGREDGHKPQPRGEAGPQRAGGRGGWHGLIIRTANAGGFSPQDWTIPTHPAYTATK